MAAEQLQIQVQANVQQAITGLNTLNTQLGNTSAAATELGAKSLNVLNNQLQRLQRIAANPNLSSEQYKRLGDLIKNTAKEADTLSKSLRVLNTSQGQLKSGTGQATFALTNFGRVASDAPFGIIGIANNIDPLVQSFVSLRKETGSTGGALKALGASLTGGGGLILGISLVTSALQFVELGLSRWGAKTKEAKQKQDELSGSIAQQYTQALLLKNAYERDKSLEGRKEILSQLNTVSSEYFGNLKAEQTSIEDLKKSYDGYIQNLLQSFAVKQLEADLEPLVKQLAVAQSTVRKIGPDLQKLNLVKDITGLTGAELEKAIKYNQQLQDGFTKLNDQQRKALSTSGVFKYNQAVNESNKLWNQINELINNSTVLYSKSVKKTESGKTKEETLQDRINSLLKDYNDELKGIKYEGQIKGLNVSNQLLETNLSFLVRAAKLVGETGQAYKTINADTQRFADAAANQKIVDVITSYQTALSELDIKQAVTGQDQLNARINAATDALIKLKTLGVQDTNEEVIKLRNTLNTLQSEVGLREIRKRTEEITKTWEKYKLQVSKLDFNQTKDGLDKLKSKIDLIGNTIQDLKSKGLTEKDLGIQILSIQFEQLGVQFEKLKKQEEFLKSIQTTISEGLTGAVDGLIDAFASGEDPFEALQQSVKGLIIELTKLIAKQLIYNAISTALNLAAPGAGSALQFAGQKVRLDYLFTGLARAGTASDRRLKENIIEIGISASGLKIYTFNYIDYPEMRYQGVMAQDLLGTKHEKAIKLVGNFYAVNYSLLDVQFKRVA